MKLYFIDSKQLLDSAFRDARKKVKSMSTKGLDDKFRQIRTEESMMLTAVADYIIEKLSSTAQSFPDFSESNPFYLELVESTIDLTALKKAISHLTESSRIVKKLKFEALKKLHGVKRIQKWDSMSLERKKFYGRAAGVLRKADSSITVLKKSLSKLRELPHIDENSFNVVFAGFPNSGKSTMLERMTGSKPEIAHYAFTTKSIQQGFIVEDFVKVQVFDTPGLLDRMPSERNPIERKAASALRHLAEFIVFIADVSKNSGYSAKEQFSLFEKLKAEFPKNEFVAVLNKCDIANESLRQEMHAGFEKSGIPVFEEGEGLEILELRNEIVKKARVFFKKKFSE
ncbi:MAG: GTPase [Candidatus Diapherotrites archaeon]|nr:GTPase [Candidatus Diapherotrites archaeon]